MLVFIEWRIDDRITVVMLNIVENQGQGVRRGTSRGLKANSGALLYKIMRSCMTLSNREDVTVYELHIYVATVLERLYRLIEREQRKNAI